LFWLLYSLPAFAQRVLSDPKFKTAEDFVAKDH